MDTERERERERERACVCECERERENEWERNNYVRWRGGMENNLKEREEFGDNEIWEV